MLDLKKICELYDNGSSIREIAMLYETYPNKISRALKKSGKELRSREEAAKVAVNAGKIKPPMLGKKRTQEEKDNISVKRSQKWKEMPDKDLEDFRQAAKERWDSLSVQDRMDNQRKAGEALRRASVEGSKAEKFLYERLTKEGYDVIIHKTGLIPGQKYEVDLFMPSMLIAIEIDGPQHFLPVYGEENLRRNIKYDSIKNGALLGRGMCVIRVRYMLKHNSQSSNVRLFELVLNTVKQIEAKFPEPQDRFIELEISND
jgi:very-short-patch-repair endonuclease